MGFNTQPPEGGCRHTPTGGPPICWFQHTAARRRLRIRFGVANPSIQFQHTAARRRLQTMFYKIDAHIVVSTHSRPKAAALCHAVAIRVGNGVSTHSRPKAAATARVLARAAGEVSTHSRPKAAACHHRQRAPVGGVSTHSRPKAAAAGS